MLTILSILNEHHQLVFFIPHFIILLDAMSLYMLGPYLFVYNKNVYYFSDFFNDNRLRVTKLCDY